MKFSNTSTNLFVPIIKKFMSQYAKKPLVDTNKYLPLSIIDKKNYYLPAPTNKHLSLMLKNIPGTWTPRDTFYTSPKASADINKIINNGIIKLLGQEVINSPSDLAMAIKRLLTYSKALGISEDYYYPMLQHILVSIYPHVKFPKEVLSIITKNNVDYSSFPAYVEGPLAIIEANVFDITLGDFITANKDKIKIFAQNHTDIGALEQYKNDSYKQTGQPFADFRIENIDNKKLLFFDVKSKTDPIKNVNLLKGSLSLTIKTCDQYIIKIKGDLPSAIDNKKKLKLLSDPEIKALNKIMKKIELIITKKPLSLEAKFNQMLTVIKDSFLNADINNITFSIIIEHRYDKIDDIDYLDCSDIPELNNKILFPQDGKSINIYDWKKIYKDKVIAISEKQANLEIKELILDNYKRIEQF